MRAISCVSHLDSVLKIITLRDEGIALSLAEGTATLRLARFDNDHEYFEIDAPQTTIAAESKGVYRLEADRKGAIHLTVRDGGRARVYSDTAGFTVRDGHSATLTYEGAGSRRLANCQCRGKGQLGRLGQRSRKLSGDASEV